MRKFSTGDSGWGICITSGTGAVEVAITGPQSGHYNGDWMTPEQAEEIGLGLIHSAQDARDKAASAVSETVAA
jgi:hypothetical protein